MEEVEKQLKTSVEELERLLNARNVVGEPITHDGVTVVPLVSFGFGFGAGGGRRKDGETGGGSGGGGGIKPVALVIIGKDGTTQVQSIKGTGATMVESVGAVVGEVVTKARSARGHSTAKEKREGEGDGKSANA